MVSALDLRSEGRELEPSPHNATFQQIEHFLSSPRCIDGHHQIVGGQTDKMFLGRTLSQYEPPTTYIKGYH